MSYSGSFDIPERSLCLFDFDGTISVSDTFIPFCLYTFGYTKTLQAFGHLALDILGLMQTCALEIRYFHTPESEKDFIKPHHPQHHLPLLAALCSQEPDESLSRRSLYKAHLIYSLFSQVPCTFVEQKAAAFAQLIYQKLRPQALTFLRTLSQRDIERTMVSASLSVYLKPLAQLLDIPTVIATELQVDPTGHTYTGSLLGPNCIGMQKLLNVQQHYPHLQHFSQVHVFGDSKGDHAMMTLADINAAHMHPFNPKHPNKTIKSRSST